MKSILLTTAFLGATAWMLTSTTPVYAKVAVGAPTPSETCETCDPGGGASWGGYFGAIGAGAVGGALAGSVGAPVGAAWGALGGAVAGAGGWAAAHEEATWLLPPSQTQNAALAGKTRLD